MALVSLIHSDSLYRYSQGDSALIESPTGKKILIDSGPSKSWKALHYLLRQTADKRNRYD